ncbi:hypothetical protein P3S67_022892 [Capsicum chacoense]
MRAAFVKEHKKMLVKTTLMKMDEGLSWEAKIVREVSDYFICHRDWPQFVVYNKLDLGDMLLFNTIHKSTFQVLLYSTKPRINIQCCEELRSSDKEKVEKEEVVENIEEEEDEEEIIKASRRSKKLKTEANESSSSKWHRSLYALAIIFRYSLGWVLALYLCASFERTNLNLDCWGSLLGINSATIIILR